MGRRKVYNPKLRNVFVEKTFHSCCPMVRWIVYSKYKREGYDGKDQPNGEYALKLAQLAKHQQAG